MLRHTLSKLLLLWSFGRDIYGTALLYHEEKEPEIILDSLLLYNYQSFSCRKKGQSWHNQNIHSVPLDLDMELRRLDLSNNFIGQLHTLGLPHLQQLDLSYNQLDLISEGAFENPAQLEDLNLSRNALNNNLGGNSKVLQSISRLRNLDISLNNLNDDAVELYLRNKSSLEHLNLTGNAIIRLTHTMFKECKGLKTIIIADNLITVIEEGTFEPLRRLETLNLANNNVAHICDFKLHQVKYLNLSQNSIEFFVTHEDEQLFRLEILDLSYNKLFYFPIVPKFIHLRYLYLQNNMIGTLDSEATMISEAKSLYKEITGREDNTVENNIYSNWRIMPLVYIDLSSNNFRSLPIETLSLLTSLETLNVSRNCLQNIKLNITKESQSGYPYQHVFPSLKYLDLQKNELRYITPLFFKASPQLEILNLQANSVKLCLPTDRSGLFKPTQHALKPDVPCVAFGQIRTLKHLNLEENNIKMLYENSFEKMSLVYLNLAKNSDMVIEVGALEGVRRSLQSLSLSEINITSRDLSLPCMPALSQLNISNNHLDTIPNILSCSPLRELDISNNGFVSLNHSLIRALSLHLNSIYVRRNYFNCCDTEWLTLLNELRIKVADINQTKCIMRDNKIALTDYLESPSIYCLFQTGLPVTFGKGLIIFIFVMVIVSTVIVFVRIGLASQDPLGLVV